MGNAKKAEKTGGSKVALFDAEEQPKGQDHPAADEEVQPEREASAAARAGGTEVESGQAGALVPGRLSGGLRVGYLFLPVRCARLSPDRGRCRRRRSVVLRAYGCAARA